ncbi:MAG TPA: hypothetical protein VKF42_06880 [Chitinivibrionales bacterium]|jgi:uncharacterized membrane protein|nr:hypothetical protein [Chitinivibrionales bacterium]
MIDDLYALLARIGFKEPLHSPITHMPIGLVVGALIFFLVAVIFKRKNLVLTARHASILAFIFAFPTIMLGVMDWIHFYHAALFVPIIIKMTLAGIALIVLGTGIILGSEIKLHTMTMTILYVIAFVAMIGLGYFGSGIIYGRGLQIKAPKFSVAAGGLPAAGGPTDSAGRKHLAAESVTVKSDTVPKQHALDSARAR